MVLDLGKVVLEGLVLEPDEVGSNVGAELSRPGEEGGVVLSDALGVKGRDGGRHLSLGLGGDGLPHSASLDVGELEEYLRSRLTALPLQHPRGAHSSALCVVEHLGALHGGDETSRESEVAKLLPHRLHRGVHHGADLDLSGHAVDLVGVVWRAREARLSVTTMSVACRCAGNTVRCFPNCWQEKIGLKFIFLDASGGHPVFLQIWSAFNQ